MKKIYVQHEDGPELGLIAPEFKTEAEAKRKCAEWNRETSVHRVVVVDDGTDSLRRVTRNEISTLLDALSDAVEWQKNIADANTVQPWHQSSEMTSSANKALKQAKKYTRLAAKIRRANAESIKESK